MKRILPSGFITNLASRLWNSPTVATWGSFASRSLNLVVILPLALNRFSAEEIVVWSLLSSVIGLQILADVGFGSTFTRAIAYALGGASDLKDFRDPTAIKGDGQPDWEVVKHICSTMRGIYNRLTFAWVCVISILGTWALIKPITATSDSQDAWLAWGFVIVTSAITLRGNLYSAYLQGVNQITLLRRWEILTSLASVMTSFLVLLLGGGLAMLVIANQGWFIINVLRDRWLCFVVEQGRFKQSKDTLVDPTVMAAVWPSAWRSGLGIFMTSGLVQASNFFYAQVGTAAGVASYLVALRLIQAVSQFSQAPFYTRIPLLARLRSEGKLQEQVVVAQRGMRLAYWSYAAGFIGIGIGAGPILNLVGSKATFVSPLLWALLGIGLLAERYGAMHLQLYSTTNHIIWHIASAGYGIIYLTVCLLLFKVIGVYTYPIGLIAGYIGFYSWYSAKHSYQAFQLNFWKFERDTFFAPLTLVVAYILISICYYSINHELY